MRNKTTLDNHYNFSKDIQLLGPPYVIMDVTSGARDVLFAQNLNPILVIDTRNKNFKNNSN